MNEEDWVELLREAHQEPIDQAHYAAVRARVLAELGRQRRPVWRWAWVGSLAAAAMVLAFVMIPRPTPVGQASWPAFLPQAPVPVYGPAAPSQRAAGNGGTAMRRRPQSVVRVRQQEGRPGGPPHQDQEPMVIKLLTDDPNVVIYWIGE